MLMACVLVVVFVCGERTLVCGVRMVVWRFHDVCLWCGSCVCVSCGVSVSLALGQGHGQAQVDTGPQALPDQQRSAPSSLCVFVGLLKTHLSIPLFAAQDGQITARWCLESELVSQLRPNSRRRSTRSRIGARVRSHAANRPGWNSAPSQLHLHWTSHLMDRSSTGKGGNDQIPLTTETGSQYQEPGTGIAADTSTQYLQAVGQSRI